MNQDHDGGDRRLDYVVSEGGARDARFGTLGAALDHLESRRGQRADSVRDEVAWDAARTGTHIRISCRPRDATRVPAAGRARRYYIEPLGGLLGGDGSARRPWEDWATALADLRRRHVAGRLALRPTESLVLWQRPAFAANAHEHRKRLIESLARALLLGITILLVLPLLAILAHLAIQAWPALSWSFLLENPRDFMTAGGVWAPLVGTFCLVTVSLLVAAPLGVLAGVYLHEYAGDTWRTRLVSLAVMNLAGVPSIVHALFGVGAFVLFAGLGRSLLAASCTVAVMTLPVIITSTREALAAVPVAFREACWNLGASRWQTIYTMVLPNALSGILTGVILQVSRAAGETAPILFTGAVFFTPTPAQGVAAYFPYGIHDRFMALSMHLFTLSTQVEGVSDAMQYATAVVLIGLVLAVNATSIAMRVYLRTRKKW